MPYTILDTGWTTKQKHKAEKISALLEPTFSWGS